MCRGLKIAHKQKDLKTDQRKMLRLLLSIIATHVHETRCAATESADEGQGATEDVLGRRRADSHGDSVPIDSQERLLERDSVQGATKMQALGVVAGALVGCIRHPCRIQDFLKLQVWLIAACCGFSG